MIKQVDSITFRLLVLAKRLYLHGCVHASNKDEISKMIAIHNFDNAIEFILKCLATQYTKIKSAKDEFKFKDLWNEINIALPSSLDPLPFEDQIKALHDLRNGVQHAGDIPDLNSVIKYQGYSEDFFKKVVKKYFGVSYDQMTLATLIDNPQLKDMILSAEKALESGQYDKCMSTCMNTFYSASFKHTDAFYKAGYIGAFWGLSLDFENFINDQYIETKYGNTPYYELAQEVSEAFQQLGQASMAMQFLDEFKVDFLKFAYTINDTRINRENLSEPEIKERTKSVLEFVTNLILKWQEIGLLK